MASFFRLWKSDFVTAFEMMSCRLRIACLSFVTNFLFLLFVACFVIVGLAISDTVNKIFENDSEINKFADRYISLSLIFACSDCHLKLTLPLWKWQVYHSYLQDIVCRLPGEDQVQQGGQAGANERWRSGISGPSARDSLSALPLSILPKAHPHTAIQPVSRIDH